ncbi:MAG: PKD domain-containing protein [Bacteroidia bacterium]
MNLIKLFLFAFAMLIFCPQQTSASHIMGSDIGWKCLGNDSFLITITIYRDCNGVTTSANAIGISGIGCSFSQSISTTLSSPIDITPICKGNCTRCIGGSSSCSFPYGIQKQYLTGIVDLSSVNCCDFRLSLQACCRNSNITTGADDQNYYTEAFFSKCDTPCNNSPRFMEEPVRILCVNQCFIGNLGAVDGDGDSLVYSLTPPLQSSGTNTSWNSPYTYFRPLYFDQFPNANTAFNYPQCRGFHVDSFTGEFRFKPRQAQISIFAMKVEEYRNGNKIGELRRDMQTIIMNCPSVNGDVQLSGIDSTQSYLAEACAGESLCFEVESYDSDLTDSVKLSFDSLYISGATFVTSTNKRYQSGIFCWTPQISDTGRTHYFTVTAADNDCPFPYSITKRYGVYVFPDSISGAAGKNLTLCENDSAIQLLAKLTGGTWTGPGVQDSIFHPGVAGAGAHTLLYSFQRATCNYEDSIEVTVLPNPIAGFTATPAYGPVPLTVAFTDTSKGTIALWKWDFGDMDLDSVQHPTHDYLSPDTFDVGLIVTDSNGCSDSVLLKDSIITIAAGINFTVCQNDEVRVLKGSHDVGNWSGAGVADSLFDPSIAGTGKHWLLYTVMINGVSVSDSLEATVLPSPVAKFSASPESGPIPLNVQFSDSSAGNIVQWQWDLGDNAFDSVQHPTYNYQSIDTFDIGLIVTDSNGCRDSVLLKDSIITIAAGINFTVCLNDGIQVLKGSHNVGNWSGAGVADSLFDPSNAGTGTHWLIYTVMINGVSVSDSLEATVLPIPDAQFSAFPESGPVPLNVQFSDSSLGNIIRWKWDFGDSGRDTLQHPSNFYTTVDTFDVQLVVIDSVGCSDTLLRKDYINISEALYAGPDFDLCSNLNPKLLSGYPTGGAWTGPGVTDSLFDPALAGTGSHLLIYTVIINGVSFSDSLAATVNPVPVAGFTAMPLNSPLPVTVQFNDTSSGMIAKWQWDFGDFSADSIVSPAHSYSLPDSFDVSLVVTDSLGCRDTVVKKEYIVVVDSVDAGADITACKNAGTLNLVGAPAGGTWSGTGVTGSLFDPMVAGIGSHTLTYTFQIRGSAFSDSLRADVLAPPQANFSAIPFLGFAPLSVNFTDSSTGKIARWEWNFGDFSFDSIQHPKHLYLSPDSFDISLIVEDSMGCRDTSTRPDYVWVVDSAYVGTKIHACNNDLPALLPTHPQGGQWSGPGVQNDVFYPGVAGVGAHWLVYTINYSGDNSSDSVEVIITSAPQAGFQASPLTGALPLTVNFSDTSVGNIAKWHWNFGDTSTSNNQHPAHDYHNVGTYTVSLFVEDSLGCRDTSQVSNMINVLVGIQEDNKTSLFLVYPNPVKNELVVRTASVCRDCRIQLISSEGRVVWDEMFNQQELRMHRGELSAGTYVLRFVGTKGNVAVRKVVLE